MLCTSLLNNSYLVSECQKLPGHILFFKDKNTSLFLGTFHTPCRKWVCMEAHREMVTSTGIGTPTHGKNMKPPQISSFLHFLKEGISWLVWLVHPQATSLPGKKDRSGLVPPTLVPTERPCSWGQERCQPSCGTWGL